MAARSSHAGLLPGALKGLKGKAQLGKQASQQSKQALAASDLSLRRPKAAMPEPSPTSD